MWLIVVAVIILVWLYRRVDHFNDYISYKSSNLSALIKGSGNNIPFNSYRKIYPELNVVEYYKLRNIDCDDNCTNKIASILA